MVISGGGMKGVAMMGALAEFQDAGWLDGVDTFAGTSIGAVLATMLATGKTLDRVFDAHVHAFKYKPSFDIGGLDKVFGLDTGDGLRTWIDAVMDRPLTFQQVRDLHGATLLVCATNMNALTPVYFGPDTHPDLDVGAALRMSCGIPLYFAATTYKHELYVDGALTDNFPITAAARAGAQSVLGVRITPTRKPPKTTWSLEGFVGAILECATAPTVLSSSSSSSPKALIAGVDAGATTQPMNFKMAPQATRALFLSGREQGQAFIALQAKKRM